MPKFTDEQLAAMTDFDLSLRSQIALGRVTVWAVNDDGLAFVIPWYFDPLPTKDRMRAREIMWPGTSRPYVPTLCGVGSDYTERMVMGEAAGIFQLTTETERAFCERIFRVIDPKDQTQDA